MDSVGECHSNGFFRIKFSCSPISKVLIRLIKVTKLNLIDFKKDFFLIILFSQVKKKI